MNDAVPVRMLEGIADLPDESQSLASVELLFKDRAAVEARVRRTLGETYFRIGRPEKARTQLLRAKGLSEGLGDANPRTIAELSYKIAETHWRGHEADETEKAITMLRPLLADFEERFGADDELSINARNGLAGALKWAGRLDEAEALYTQVLRSRREVLGDANADTIMTRYNLALISTRISQMGTYVRV